jgi:hypothetical protein
VAVHSIHDAAVAGNKVAEILDFESSLEAGREEAAKRCDKGRENAESGDVVLERPHKHRLANSKEAKQRAEERRYIVVNWNEILCGFFLGKRFINQPLTKLSPKKSWEGFVGGFICTLIWGFIFSWLLARFPILTCPVRLDANWHVLSTCEASEYFIPVDHNVPLFLRPLFGLFGIGETVLVRPFQHHIAALGVFASFIAPFGGFFASGFKRAFKVKDFGDLIPGHGGVMDRMDCHFVMQSFTNVYLSTFIRTPSVQTILLAATKLTLDEQKWLIEQLRANLVSESP